jgi:3-hydroxyisobutyrate dehydrogenase-like beta-hydroxyacid dehydrogenase
MMLSGEFEPNFPLEHSTKDSRLIVAAAREAGLELPLAEAFNEYFVAALEAGRGKEDMAAIFDYVGTENPEG